MRIALVNPIIQTVDRPEKFWNLFGRTPLSPLESDSEVNFVKLAQGIAREGHQVTLFVSDVFRPLNPSRPEGGLTVRYLKTRFKFCFPPAYLPFLPSLHRELKMGQFDVVQSSELFQPSTFIAALSGAKIFVWEEMDQYFSRRGIRLLQKCHHQTIERWLKEKVRVIPRSRAAESFLKGRGWKRVCRVIPTPVDTSVFSPLPGGEEKYLLVVSRLAPDRGLDFLLDVMVEVSNKKPEIKLLLLGNGSMKEKLNQEIQRRKLSQHIEIRSDFLTHSEMNRVYNDSCMGLITTEGGLYPYTAFESMAAGKVVVSRFQRGLKDLIREGETGYLVKSVGEMAGTILTLLKEPQTRHQAGKRAREFIFGYCSLKKVAKDFIEVYQT